MRRLGSLFVAALVAVAVLVAAPSKAAVLPAPPEVEPWLVDQLTAAAPTAPFAVFAHAADGSAATAAAAADAAGLDLARSFSVGTVLAVGTAAEVVALTSDTRLDYVQGDRPLSLSLDTANTATRAFEADASFSGADGPYQGQGMTIAVIDSGVDGTHPFFVEDDGTSKVERNLKLACGSPVQYASDGRPYPLGACAEAAGLPQDTFFLDFSDSNDTDTISAGGHGTHVAGIAAGSRVTDSAGRTLQGAAPRAKLVSISVGAAVSVYGAAEALQWVVDNHENPCAGSNGETTMCPPIKVVNNSYGSGGGTYNPNDITALLGEALVDSGVTMVWAAGNDGGDGTDNMVNPPAQSPKPGVIGVANYDDGDTGTRDGTLSSSSSRGLEGDPTTYPDLSAPGTQIASSCRPYLPVCQGLDLNDPDYNSITGTSMAAPYVAGTAARLLSASASLSPAQIEDILEDTAYKFSAGGAYETDPRNGDDTTSFDKGHGLVDVTAALAAVLGAPSDGGDPPAQVCDNRTLFVDPSGDAQGLLVFGGTAFPNDPHVDLLDGWVEYTAATGDSPATLTFGASIEDLRAADQAPSYGAGEVFDFEFGFGGPRYYVRVENSFDTAPSFELRRAGDGQAGTSDVTIADSGITGVFDAENDVFAATVPVGAFVGEGMETAAPGPGTTIDKSTISVVSYRMNGTGSTGGLLTSVDDATGSCSYTVATATAEPDPDPAPAKPGKGNGRDKNPNK